MAEVLKRAIVYVVDDDCDLGASLTRLLKRSGNSDEPFVDPEQLLAAYATAPADCILTDVLMGEVDGFAFANKLREIDPTAAIIFMTAWPTVSSAVDALRRFGGLDYLEKPVDEKRLLAVIGEGVAWSKRRRAQLERTANLSPREYDAFALLGRGYRARRSLPSSIEPKNGRTPSRPKSGQDGN